MESGAFWEDFCARASLRPQLQEAAERPAFALRWAMATAAAVLLAVGIVRYERAGSAAVPVNNVLALNVATPHRGVLIMNDDNSGGTILWIDCDDAPAGGAGGVL